MDGIDFNLRTTNRTVSTRELPRTFWDVIFFRTAKKVVTYQFDLVIEYPGSHFKVGDMLFGWGTNWIVLMSKTGVLELRCASILFEDIDFKAESDIVLIYSCFAEGGGDSSSIYNGKAYKNLF